MSLCYQFTSRQFALSYCESSNAWNKLAWVLPVSWFACWVATVVIVHTAPPHTHTQQRYFKILLSCCFKLVLKKPNIKTPQLPCKIVINLTERRTHWLDTHVSNLIIWSNNKLNIPIKRLKFAGFSTWSH